MNPQLPTEIQIIFTAATAIGVLLQAGILLGMFLGLRRVQTKIENLLSNVSDHALPLIVQSKASMEELAPKLKIITENLVEISETLKSGSSEVKFSVDDVLERTRAQTARVDEMVSGTLDGITHAGAAIQHGIEVPLRQLSGILSGLRAGFGVLRKKSPSEYAAPIKVDEEPFMVAVVEEDVVVTRTL